MGAVAKGHLEIVKLLLQDSRVDPAAKDDYDNYGECLSER